VELGVTGEVWSRVGEKKRGEKVWEALGWKESAGGRMGERGGELRPEKLSGEGGSFREQKSNEQFKDWWEK